MASAAPASELLSYKILNWIILVSCALIWGCSYYFIKKGLVGFEPMQVVGIRIAAAGTVLIPFLFLALKKIPFNKYPYVMLCALFGNGIPIYLFPLAQTHISSSVAGIINSLTPLCTYAIGILFFSMENKRVKLAGVLAGLLGVFCLLLFKPQSEFKADILFLAVALAAPVMYGINNNILKKHLTNLPSIPLTSLIYSMLLIPSIFIVFLTDVPTELQRDEAAQQAFPYVILLGLFGTAVAISLINILIRRTHIMFATSVAYLIPVVAVLIGFFDQEKVGWNEFCGLALILGGVLLINRAK